MLTEQQKEIIAKNAALYDAYDAIINACEINQMPFDQFLECMTTLHGIKSKQKAELNP